MNQKLSKNKFERKIDSWAVDVDYKLSIPVVEQINNKVVSAIRRIQGPVLNLMCVFGVEDISSYCGNIDKVTDICSIYHSTSKQKFTEISDVNVMSDKREDDEEEMLKRLINLALDFNASNGSNDNDSIKPINASNIITDITAKINSIVEGFDCKFFFRFVSQDIRNNNIRKMLHYMSESMNTIFETQKVNGSISSLQKVQLLQ